MAEEDVQEAWRRYFPLVREKCRRVLKDVDDADDVAQDVFIRFWQGRAPRDVRGATAWLYKTATHLCIDRLRHRSMRERPVPQASRAPDLEASTGYRQVLEQLISLAADDELQAAVLSRLDGLTHPEAAEVLGISERTVRRLLTRFDDRVAAQRLEVQS